MPPKISSDLSRGNREILNRFLLGHSSQPDAQARGSEYVRKNEIMNVLRNQNKQPAELAEVLIKIYQDRAQDVVIRDYAVQHLSSWYEQRADEHERKRIENLLWSRAPGNGDLDCRHEFVGVVSVV